jgi:glutathione S-transferase
VIPGGGEPFLRDTAQDGEAPALELYQIEGCSYCANVRETLDDLGLDYVVRTEPAEHARRRRVLQLSGQSLVPVLVDAARGVVLPESRDIISYLREHYATRR